jgi:hypothetical protein
LVLTIAVLLLACAGEGDQPAGGTTDTAASVVSSAPSDSAGDQDRGGVPAGAMDSSSAAADAADASPPPDLPHLDLRALEPAARPAAIALARFGERLARVSLLAPPDVLDESLRSEFGPYVTQQLLDAWLAEPESAPGRVVSSPWPDRIEVTAAQPLDRNAYEVSGEVVLVTSAEVERGSGEVGRFPVTARVERTADGVWLIAGWRSR